MENTNFRPPASSQDHRDDIIIEENDLDIDEGNERFCEACTLPIFSTPYQPDESKGEGHFLHKCCAKLNPHLSKHPLHAKQLILHKQSDLDPGSIVCNNCGRECNGGFFYQCPDDDCRFALDVLCATSVIRIVHRSHKHELVPFRRGSNKFTCGGCGLEHEGEFYWCDLCYFYLHQDCALLPNTIQYSKHNQHFLSLTYALPTESLKYQKSDACSICKEKLSSVKSGMYFCLSCDYNIHIKCVLSEPRDLSPVSSRNAADGLIHLPMQDEHTNLLHYILEKKTSHDDTNEEKEKLLVKEYHDHDLIFHDKDGDVPSQSTTSSLCNACIKPISPPFYRCHQCDDFYLHIYCTKLPLNYQHPAHEIYSQKCKDQLLTLVARLPGKFLSMFRCHNCDGCYNGFIYSCEKCAFKMDVSCALLPEAITYDAHGKFHILFLSYSTIRMEQGICHCCKEKATNNFYYECCSCPNFKLHAHCAILPSSVSHKFDRHRLKLVSPKFSTPGDGNLDFCEICENGMDTRSWIYHCKECGTNFHINCIPCVGRYSKIRFGGPIHVQCHDCPLISIRQLTNYSYECNRCRLTLNGWGEDGIAFECIKCCYWLCYWCAQREWVRDDEFLAGSININS